MGWYGIVLGAAASWQSGVLDQKKFDADFDWSFFRNQGNQFVGVIRALGSVGTTAGTGVGNEQFWRDPFNTPYQTGVRTNAERIRKMRIQVEEAEEVLILNRQRAKKNKTMIPSMLFAARRYDHLGRRAQTVEKLSREYWDAYLNLGDRVKVRRLRRYSSPIYDQLREMAEELSELKTAYREQWLAENRPYWLESVLARYDSAMSMWLNKSQAVEEALRRYDSTSILPDPEEFGLGPRVLPTPATPRQ